MEKFEIRPWGWFEVLTEDVNYKVKRLVVCPGKRLSYQYHNKRKEHWVVVQGDGVFIYGNDNSTFEKTVETGSSIFIEIGEYHRIQNTGESDLIIIETKLGQCDEEDIVRIVDDFNRV
jgi:mannose-6-phosphate isomerase-like protein (cupin superfamily)